MSDIAINEANLTARATGLRRAGENFEEQTLSPIDGVSTISANANSEISFGEAQTAHQVLRDALVQSGTDIKGIGDRFFTIDEGAATGWESN